MSHRGSKAFGFTSECANAIGLESGNSSKTTTEKTTISTTTKTSTKQYYKKLRAKKYLLLLWLGELNNNNIMRS